MANKICPECGTEQEESSRFCKNCGIQFFNENKNDGEDNSTKCSKCGTQLHDYELFCPECGTPTGKKISPNSSQKTEDADSSTHQGYRINRSVKYCSNCGSEMDSKARICPKCSAKQIYKSPILAAALSFIFPGLGQFYNDQPHKAILLIIAYIISFILIFIVIGLILIVLIWLYGIYDALMSANAINDGEVPEDRLFGI